jgi:hypothetical protein
MLEVNATELLATFVAEHRSLDKPPRLTGSAASS